MSKILVAKRNKKAKPLIRDLDENLAYFRKHLFEALEIPEEYHHLLKGSEKTTTED